MKKLSDKGVRELSEELAGLPKGCISQKRMLRSYLARQRTAYLKATVDTSIYEIDRILKDLESNGLSRTGASAQGMLVSSLQCRSHKRQ